MTRVFPILHQAFPPISFATQVVDSDTVKNWASLTNISSMRPPFPTQVVGFDMVDDESKPERRPTKHCPPPAEWNSKHNCAYSYYAYYVYANLFVLNKFR